jgi:hypothetical protein
MDDKLARLKEIGFVLAGTWSAADTGIFCALGDFGAAKNVLYAFAVDGDLAYVGKTVQPLRARLAGYRTPGPTQSTNIKNNRKIRGCLGQKRLVEIYVLPDTGLLHFGGFHLNLAAALEDSLVRELEPPWNGGQKEGPDQSFRDVETPTVAADGTNTEGGAVNTSATAADFRNALFTMPRSAAETEERVLDVTAGQLHRRVGGYPGANHRMPVCCSVMRTAMTERDSIVDQPPKGDGASLKIRYKFPRMIP